MKKLLISSMLILGLSLNASENKPESLLNQPMPAKYKLTFKDGLKYANYGGAAASVGMAVSAFKADWAIFVPVILAGATLNALSATIDPEKHKKSNIALIVANALCAAGHAALLTFIAATEPLAGCYWIAKGALNITNAVYRTAVAIKKNDAP